MKKKLATAATASALAAMIAACGGGGGSSGSSSSSTAAQNYAISGVAATGAAYRGQVQLQDSSGVKFDCGSAADSGAYSCSLPLTAKAPFVVTITDTTNPDAQPMVSVLAEQPVAGQTTIININPLTDGIARTLVKGEADALADASKFKDKVTVAAVKDLVDAMGVVLGNLAKAAGMDKFDPIKTPMKTDGSGLDKVLDLTQVQVVVNDSGKASAVITTQINGKNYTLTITPTDSSASSSASSSTTSSAESLPSAEVIAADPMSKLPAEAKAIAELLTTCFSTAAPRDWTAAGCKDVAALALPGYLNDGKTFVAAYAAKMTDTTTASEWNKAKVISSQILYVDPEETLGGVQLPQRAAVRFKAAITQENGSTVTKSFIETLTYKDGKWKALGNQFKYKISANASVRFWWDANQAENRTLGSGIRFYVSNKDVEGQNIKAVRITGAGLPAEGLVYVPDPSGSSTTFLINNNWGEVKNLLMNSSKPSNAWAGDNFYQLTMASVGVDNSMQETWSTATWTESERSSNANNTNTGFITSYLSRGFSEIKTATGLLNNKGLPTYVYRRATKLATDLDEFEAMPRYQYEFFDSNDQLVSVQKLRLLSKPLSLKAASALPLSGYSEDTLDYLRWGNAKAVNQSKVTIKWTQNPLAPVISNVQSSGSIRKWTASTKTGATIYEGTESDIDLQMQFVQPTVSPTQTSITLDQVNNCSSGSACLSYLPGVGKSFSTLEADSLLGLTAGTYVGSRSFTLRYTRPDGVTVYNSVQGQRCRSFTSTVAGKNGPLVVCS